VTQSVPSIAGRILTDGERIVISGIGAMMPRSRDKGIANEVVVMSSEITDEIIDIAS
jgi:hypothetical protein